MNRLLRWPHAPEATRIRALANGLVVKRNNMKAYGHHRIPIDYSDYRQHLLVSENMRHFFSGVVGHIREDARMRALLSG